MLSETPSALGKLLHLAFTMQSWQPRHAAADIQFRARIRLLQALNIIERACLNDGHSMKCFCIANFGDCTAASSTERVGEGHAAVLGGGKRLRRTRRYLESILWNEKVGGKCTPTQPAASQAVTDSLGE